MKAELGHCLFKQLPDVSERLEKPVCTLGFAERRPSSPAALQLFLEKSKKCTRFGILQFPLPPSPGPWATGALLGELDGWMDGWGPGPRGRPMQPEVPLGDPEQGRGDILTYCKEPGDGEGGRQGKNWRHQGLQEDGVAKRRVKA